MSEGLAHGLALERVVRSGGSRGPDGAGVQPLSGFLESSVRGVVESSVRGT